MATHKFEFEYIYNKVEPENHIEFVQGYEDHQKMYEEYGYSKTENKTTAVEDVDENGNPIIRNITVTTNYIYDFTITTKITITTTGEIIEENGKLTEEEVDDLVGEKIPDIQVAEDHYTETKVLGEKSHDIKVDLVKGIDMNQYIITAMLDGNEYRNTIYNYTLDDAAENKQDELVPTYQALIEEVQQYVEDHTHFIRDPIYKYMTNIKFSDGSQLQKVGALKEYEAKNFAYDHLVEVQNFFYDKEDCDVVTPVLSTLFG